MHTRTFRCALALIALSALTPLTAQAQGMPHPPGMRAPGGPMMHGPGGPGRMQRMSQALNLTPQQQAKLQPIMSAQRGRMMALFSSTSLSQSQKFQKMQAMRQAADAKINAILTPVQRQKMAVLRAQMMQRRHSQSH